MSVAAILLGADVAIPQTKHDQTDQVLGLLSAQLITDLRADSLAHTVPKPNASGWVVRVATYNRNAKSFASAVLSVVNGRPAVRSDTLIETLKVYPPRIGRSSAVFLVDRGTVWCHHGALLRAGTIYEYRFRRDRRIWRFVGRDIGVSYDPPPTTATVTAPSCIPAYAR